MRRHSVRHCETLNTEPLHKPTQNSLGGSGSHFQTITPIITKYHVLFRLFRLLAHPNYTLQTRLPWFSNS